MLIQQLRLTNFRALKDFSLEQTQKNNLIWGENGSGKTSILEAIYLISTGKSFRNASYKHLIHHDESSFQIYLKALSDQSETALHVGMQRDRKGAKQLKLNFDPCQKQSEITRHLPVVAIDTETYQFIDRSPQSKRSYLDWMVFHVKHQYLHLWSKLSACHKHLNAFYKQRRADEELDIWEEKFASYAEKIQTHREHGFPVTRKTHASVVATFLPRQIAFISQARQRLETRSFHARTAGTRQKEKHGIRFIE